MNKDHILPHLAKGWILTEFDTEKPVNTLLYHTILYGKIFYAINALLPNANDSMIIGYTSAQMKYRKENEKNLWGYFAEKNGLYENNLKTVQELTRDGPFTGAISKECPPRIGMWIGWQIVRSYMKNNKDVTLEQLMNEKDSTLLQQIKVGGRLFAFVGEPQLMTATLVTQVSEGNFRTESLFENAVPMMRHAPQKSQFKF